MWDMDGKGRQLAARGGRSEEEEEEEEKERKVIILNVDRGWIITTRY